MTEQPAPQPDGLRGDLYTLAHYSQPHTAKLLKRAGDALGERDRLKAINAELLAALENLLTYDRVERPAFRAEPEGSQDSAVRIRQDKLIGLEDQARAAIGKARENQT